MTAFKDHFSKVAQGYSTYRPTYPKALFDALTQLAENHECAWDVGCGNGQASVILADYFDHVVATDASANQIEAATQHPKIDFITAPAEKAPLEDDSVDFILIAQALHWFDFDAFFAEVRRVGKKGGVIAAIAYEIFNCTPEIDNVIAEFYEGDIGPYWPPERAHIEDGYASIGFPFEEITLPSFQMHVDWSLDEVLGYFSTWSAVNRYKAATGKDPLIKVDQKLSQIWGARESKRRFTWPITLKVGRL